MNERDRNFDAMLEDTLALLPPEERTVARTNPWKKPFACLTWGFALTTFHLSALGLQYFLPFVGYVLAFWGVRSLRRENRCFRALWIVTAAQALLYTLCLVLLALPPLLPDWANVALSLAGVSLQFAFLLLLRAGVRGVFQKAEKEQPGDPLRWGVLWLGALAVLGYTPLAQSWLVFLPLMALFVLLLRAMYRLGGMLGDTGYYFAAAPVRLRGMTVAALYALLTAALVSAACVVGYLPLDAEPWLPPAQTELRAALPLADFPEEFNAETQIRRAGIPAETLEMLSEEEVALLQNAVWIESHRELLMFDPIATQHIERKWSGVHHWTTYAPGKRTLQVTFTFAVMEDRRIYTIYAFGWQGGAPVWQNGIRIVPYGPADGRHADCLNARLFYEKNGAGRTAPLPRLTQATDAATLGALSYPFGAENQRGYFFCQSDFGEGLMWYNTALSWYHTFQPLHLPYVPVEENRPAPLIGERRNRVQMYTDFGVGLTPAEYEEELLERIAYYEKD